MGELFKPRGLFEVTGRHWHTGWRDKGVRPLPRASELSLNSTKARVEEEKENWYSGLQPSRGDFQAEPSFPSYEIRQPGDVDTGGWNQWRRDGWWCGIDDIGRRRRHIWEFHLFHCFFNGIDLWSGRMKDWSVLKCLDTSISQSGDDPYHQLLKNRI